MEELPSNSHRNRREPDEPKKKIEKVVQGEVVQRKKPITKRFSEKFFAGRADTVGDYVFWDVLIPAAQDTVSDMIQSFVDRMLFGDGGGGTRRSSSRRRGITSTGSYTPYNRMSSRGGPIDDGPRAISQRSRQRHDFGEIALDSRAEADEVLENLWDLIQTYKAATVSDLYELLGVTPGYTDDKWGWIDLDGSGVRRRGGKYILDLPPTEPMD